MTAAQQPPSQTFDHVAYPAFFPVASVAEMLRIAKGGTIQAELQSFAAASWNVIGFGLSIYPGRAPVVINGLPVAQGPALPTEAELEQLRELCQALESGQPVEAPVVGSVGPVGSDLSVFIRNISLIGFVPALKQFILDIFNIRPAA